MSCFKILKLHPKISLTLVFALFPFLLQAQTAREVAVEIKASWVSGLGITLNWRYDASTTSYDVYKRSGNSWVKKKNTSGLTWTDSFAVEGVRYEYRVARNSSSYSFTWNGYISAGFKIPATENLGKVLLVLDSNYSVPLSYTISQYKQQLTNEGWTVIQKSFLRTAAVTDIKSWIKSQWDTDSNNLTAVILLGKIPIPYSGNFRPDGHTDHTGAWPADMYYGTFWSSWTDVSVNNTTATRSENRNVPGDGKFDRSYINPSGTATADIRYVQLPIGRIDLSNMPYFGRDTALVQRYLLKNINFRTGIFKAPNRSVIDDNFGFFAPGGEAFASGGFRNFATMAYDSITEADYVTQLKAKPYLLSYGCGPGTYDAASGVGDYKIFKTDSLLNPFTLLFGSYFGDWDNENAFLRAPLAGRGWGLASVWSGRPYWMFHHCSLGEPLHKAVLTSYNSYNIYNVGLHSSGVHTSLQGDPTLQLFPIPTITGLAVDSTNKRRVKLLWNSYSDAADSVIVEQFESGIWKRVASVLGSVNVAEFETNRGWWEFSVRPKKLIQTSSGTFWQLGARARIFASSIPYIKYYIKSGSTSDLKSLSSWSSNSNGTGGSPSDFGSDKEFILSNTSGSVNFTLNGNFEIGGKLTLPSSANLLIGSGVELKISGEIENNGLITSASGSTFILRSSLPQVLGGSCEFQSATIDCSLGVQLTGPMRIIGSITVSSGEFQSNGYLTFKSSAAGTGIFNALGNTATISGNVVTEQYIPARRAFRLLSPTVTTSDGIYFHWQEGGSSAAGYGTHITGSVSGSNGFDATSSGNPSLFIHSNSTGEWSSASNTNVQNLIAGTPYRLLVRGDRTVNLSQSNPTATATVLRATGLLKTGTVSVSGLSSMASGFSFIGNPYQSPVDMSTVLASASNINSTYYYVWDPNIGVRGSYVAVNVLTNSNNLGSAANKLLQPGQACFVQTTNSGSASLTFTESSKSTGITSVWKSELPYDEVIIKLYRSSVGQAQGILQDAATLYFDSLEFKEKHAWNAGKLINQDENLGLKYSGMSYTVFVAGTGLDTVPLYISQLRSAENVFHVEWSKNKFGYDLKLLDTYIDTTILLDTGKKEYAWVARDGELDSQRFYIVIDRKQNLGIRKGNWQVGMDSTLNTLIYPNPIERGAWMHIDNSLKSANQVRWWGINGELVHEVFLRSDSLSFRVKNDLPTGLYWVQLIGPITDTWQKVLVK